MNEGELMVTITLNEYRELIVSNVEKDFKLKEKDKIINNISQGSVSLRNELDLLRKKVATMDAVIEKEEEE